MRVSGCALGLLLALSSGCSRQETPADNPVERAMVASKKRTEPPAPYAGVIPESGPAQLTMRVRMV
jgi:hypothetical protein